METRANHILIGAFVLAVIGATFGFVVWLAKVDIDRATARYYVYTEESVSGLSVGGDVRFNGIPIGTVTEIVLDPDNPGRVRILIEVGAEAPIRTDTKASLQFQGITGVTFVQLVGGSAKKPLLKPEKDGEIPVIASVPSTLHELFAGAPQVMDRAIIVLDRVAMLVSDENLERVTGILANLDDITAALKAREPELGRVLQNVERMTDDLSQAARDVNAMVDKLETIVESTDATLVAARGTLGSINRVAGTVDKVMAKDVRLLIGDLRKTAQSMSAVGARLDTFVARNEEPLDLFTSQGLVELTKFIEEARILVSGIQRVLETVESDPARFLFGRQRGGVEAK